MDGYSLLRGLRQVLSETLTGTWMDDKFSYDCLYDAATATADRTGIFTTTQAITIDSVQPKYTLNPDFIRMYLRDSSNRYFVRWYDGTSYYWAYHCDYDDIVLNNQTVPVSVPSRFTIKYITTPVSRISGNATLNGANVNGECTLTDNSITTKFSTIVVGDEVNNISNESHGVVIEKTSDTRLITCLFDGATSWVNGDEYVITPQGRFEIYFDPPPLTSAHVATLYYVARPTPVYSLYRGYNFPIDFRDALIYYAAWKYKYRDSQPNTGDALYKYWDNFVRRYGRALNTSLNRKGFTVNLMGR